MRYNFEAIVLSLNLRVSHTVSRFSQLHTSEHSRQSSSKLGWNNDAKAQIDAENILKEPQRVFETFWILLHDS